MPPKRKSTRNSKITSLSEEEDSKAIPVSTETTKSQVHSDLKESQGSQGANERRRGKKSFVSNKVETTSLNREEGDSVVPEGTLVEIEDVNKVDSLPVTDTASIRDLNSNNNNNLSEEPGNKNALKLNSSAIQDRLFQLRLKINQGRKANRDEVEEEYKRFTNKGARGPASDAATSEELGNSKSSNGKKWQPQDIMDVTAEQAEQMIHHKQHKEQVAATYGLSAFASDASYRAYEKRLTKLGTGSSTSTGLLEENPLDYGIVGASVSAAGLERLRQDVLDREAQRSKYSRRRVHTDAEVDYINEGNAKFNKRLKSAFDKYTVEIRQNLERGTAL